MFPFGNVYFMKEKEQIHFSEQDVMFTHEVVQHLIVQQKSCNYRITHFVDYAKDKEESFVFQEGNEVVKFKPTDFRVFAVLLQMANVKPYVIASQFEIGKHLSLSTRITNTHMDCGAVQQSFKRLQQAGFILFTNSFRNNKIYILPRRTKWNGESKVFTREDAFNELLDENDKKHFFKVS